MERSWRALNETPLKVWDDGSFFSSPTSHQAPLKVLPASGSAASHLRTDVSVKSLPGCGPVLNLFPVLQKSF